MALYDHVVDVSDDFDFFPLNFIVAAWFNAGITAAAARKRGGYFNTAAPTMDLLISRLTAIADAPAIAR